MTPDPLHQKARRLHQVVEDKTIQAHGLLPMFVRAADYQLPTAADYAGAYRHRHLRGKSEQQLGLPPMHVWRAWENSLADTALYLGAAAYQYRCTQEPAALAVCRRSLAALGFVHDLGVEREEPGYWCKPYGGTYSRQTSADQLQCLATGLLAYREIAPPADRARIDVMGVHTADYLIRHGYVEKHGYFDYSADELRHALAGQQLDWIGTGLIHLPMLHLAWLASGDRVYLEERQRWYRRCDTAQRFAVPEGAIAPGHGAMMRFHLQALAMEHDPALSALWQSMIQYTATVGAHGVLPDGTSYTAWSYDPATRRLDPRRATWGPGRAREGRLNCQFALGLVKTRRWLDGQHQLATARFLLEKLDLDTFRFIMPLSDTEPLPPEWTVESRMIDHDSLVAWLFAYWEGRWRGYW